MELPNNAVARYRVMTEKSQIDIGKYAGMLVGDILKIDKDYIAYLYYSIEKYSFVDSILEQVGITERIQKPGVDLEARRRYYAERMSKYSAEEIKHYKFARWRVDQSKAKGRLNEAEKKENLSKARLQAINHGKISKL